MASLKYMIKYHNILKLHNLISKRIVNFNLILLSLVQNYTKSSVVHRKGKFISSHLVKCN